MRLSRDALRPAWQIHLCSTSEKQRDKVVVTAPGRDQKHRVNRTNLLIILIATLFQYPFDLIDISGMQCFLESFVGFLLRLNYCVVRLLHVCGGPH